VSISAFAKVGTTTPVIATIFKDYVDVVRALPIKYIYLQANKNISANLKFSAVGDVGPAPTAAHIQFASIDTADTADTTKLKLTAAFAASPTVTQLSPTSFTHPFSWATGYHAIRYNTPSGIRRALL